MQNDRDKIFSKIAQFMGSNAKLLSGGLATPMTGGVCVAGGEGRETIHQSLLARIRLEYHCPRSR